MMTLLKRWYKFSRVHLWYILALFSLRKQFFLNKTLCKGARQLCHQLSCPRLNLTFGPSKIKKTTDVALRNWIHLVCTYMCSVFTIMLLFVWVFTCLGGLSVWLTGGELGSEAGSDSEWRRLALFFLMRSASLL